MLFDIFKKNKNKFTKDELSILCNKMSDYEKYVLEKYKELSSDKSDSFDINEYRLYSNELHKVENILSKIQQLSEQYLK